MSKRSIRRHSSRCAVLFAGLAAALLLAVSPCLGAGKSEAKGKSSDADVSKEISEAYDAMKSYGYEKKKAFLAWAEKRSSELQEEIEELDARIERSNDEVRSELVEARREMQEERRALDKSMKRVRKSGKAAWEDAKWGLSAAMSKLDHAYDKALSRFREVEKDEDEEKD